LHEVDLGLTTSNQNNAVNSNENVVNPINSNENVVNPINSSNHTSNHKSSSHNNSNPTTSNPVHLSQVVSTIPNVNSESLLQGLSPQLSSDGRSGANSNNLNYYQKREIEEKAAANAAESHSGSSASIGCSDNNNKSPDLDHAADFGLISHVGIHKIRNSTKNLRNLNQEGSQSKSSPHLPGHDLHGHDFSHNNKRDALPKRNSQPVSRYSQPATNHSHINSNSASSRGHSTHRSSRGHSTHSARSARSSARSLERPSNLSVNDHEILSPQFKKMAVNPGFYRFGDGDPVYGDWQSRIKLTILSESIRNLNLKSNHQSCAL
jgi:hypothetical protein